MIIYGVRTSESTAGGGVFSCPCCRAEQPYRHVVHKRWFTLYFVPVIPLGRLGEQVECQACFSRYSPEVLFAGAQDEPYLAELCSRPGAVAAEPLLPAKPLLSAKPMLPAEPPGTSPLSIVSLILGLLSPLLLCVFGLSLLSSLAAVVTGHAALVQIRRSGGRLDGRGIATAGLVLGYVLLVVSAGVWALLGPSLYRGWKDAERQTAEVDDAAPPSPEDRLLAAEMRVLTRGSDGVAAGNSPEAQLLAEDYAQGLQLMREALFSEGRTRLLSLTSGKFLVYCELHPGRCAFIVHVPAYRDFSEDAKKLLEISAWQLAQQCVEDVLDPGDALAVGLRGAALYGAVLVGKAEEDEAAADEFTRAERDALLAFFPDEDQAVVLSSPEADEAGEWTEGAELPDSTEDAEQSPAFSGEHREPYRDMYPPLPPGFPPPGFGPPGFPPTEFASPPPTESPRDDGSPARLAGPTGAPPPAGPQEVQAARQLAGLDDIVQRFPDMGWPVHSLAFSPDGRYLAAGKLDAKLLLLDLETGQRREIASLREESGQIQTLAYSRDGGKLLAGGYRGTIEAWDVDEAGRLQPAGPLRGHARPLTCLATSPAAAFALSGSAGGDLLWQAYHNPSAPARQLAALERSVLAVHLPTSDLVAAATDGQRLLRFDLGTGQIVATYELGRSPAHAAAFSPDGNRLAISRGYEIRLVDTQTGTEVQTLSAGRDIQWSLAFLPDGQRLVSGGRGSATLWSLAGGEPLARADLGGVLYVKTLAIARDGSMLAAIPSAAGQTLTVVRLPADATEPDSGP